MSGSPSPTATATVEDHVVPEHRQLAAIRAEALFSSYLQPSQLPTPHQVRVAIADALQRHGTSGCAEAVADEFGSHPDTAVKRMAWALATTRSARTRA
jgi:hypothetical protein